MKAKVFKYKSDGNTVVAPYMELEPYAENVYLSLSRKNEYGNEDDDCFHVVCRIENVYFSSGQYSRRFLNGENRREEAAAYCRNWITDTLQGAERGAFVKLISVRVFEALGLDTAPLTQAREAYKKKQEQKRREREEKEAEERRAREELPLERFNVEEIPLEGEIVEEHAGFTDVFFYTDLTNPYAGYVLNLQKLKAYNRLMFPLAMALNREL